MDEETSERPRAAPSRRAHEIRDLPHRARAFTDAGFEYIGMDHFARPDDELARARRTARSTATFQGYTTKAGTDLIGSA
jgi:oxygen-independent coproporphyrinogen-3 oxidase